MVLVIAHLILYVEGQQKTTGNADREAKNIDKRVCLVPHHATKGYCKVISDHLFSVFRQPMPTLVPQKMLEWDMAEVFLEDCTTTTEQECPDAENRSLGIRALGIGNAEKLLA
jgi:hypothetical protein